MWGKDRTTMAFQSSDATTLIARDAELVGDLKFSGDLEIQGVVKGNIMARGDKSATVRVVEGGRVEGEIHAPTVIINGTIAGDVHSTEHVELAAKAQVEGNVHYNLIEMVKGAQINGSLVYSGQSAKTIKAVPNAPDTASGNS